MRIQNLYVEILYIGEKEDGHLDSVVTEECDVMRMEVYNNAHNMPVAIVYKKYTQVLIAIFYDTNLLYVNEKYRVSDITPRILKVN